MSHVDEMTCLLYLEGQLERPRALELSAHVEGCGECRALLHALERESRLLVHALVEEDEALPARIAAPPTRDATPWAWIVSFGLAAAGAYTLWAGFIDPWRQQLSQAGFEGTNLLTLVLFRGAFWKGWGDMLNLLQLVALATLGIVTFSLLRRSWRRWTTIAVVMSALVAALTLPPQAAAAEFKHVDSYVLPRDQVFKNDLILAAKSARIDGTVEGDLIFFGRSLEVNGHVTGDIIGFAQLCEINGTVDGNLRIFANTLLVRGPVSKNVTVFAEYASFKDKSQVGGGAMLFVSDAVLEGRIGRDLMAFTGRSTLNGYVGGDAILRGKRLSIESSTEVAGKVKYSGRFPPKISAEAKLASPPEVHIIKSRPSYASPRFYLHQALSWGAAFVFGLFLLLVAPGFFQDVVRSSRRYGPAFGFGALTLFAIPILAVIACITIVGLAVGIGTMLLWIVALYSAQVFVSTWLGEALLGRGSGTGAIIGRLALGLLLYKVAGMLPYLGFWVKLGILIWGLGALAVALYDRTRTQPVAVGGGPATA